MHRVRRIIRLEKMGRVRLGGDRYRERVGLVYVTKGSPRSRARSSPRGYMMCNSFHFYPRPILSRKQKADKGKGRPTRRCPHPLKDSASRDWVQSGSKIISTSKRCEAPSRHGDKVTRKFRVRVYMPIPNHLQASAHLPPVDSSL